MKLNPPYPYFGSKWREAPEIWKRFGDVANLVEWFGHAFSWFNPDSDDETSK